MRPLIFLLPWFLTVTLGCGSSGKSDAPEGELHMSDRISAKPKPDKAPEQPVAAKAPVAPAGKENKDEAPRKIIYTADLEIVVEDFEKASDELTKLIREQNALISSSDVRGESGTPRSGRWTIRVPEARFRDLIAALTKLGETLHNRADSDDVSEGYYDTKERLKTFEVEERGLREYYDKHAPSAKPEDMMAVRREMKQIRAEIETMKGRLNRWDDQVAYSTVVVNMRDRKDYVPPIVPDFGGRVGRVFQASIEALVSFGKGIVVAVVALAPWLLVLAVLGSPLWLRVWRAWKARKRLPTPPGAPTV
jgi:hypothetical protein